MANIRRPVLRAAMVTSGLLVLAGCNDGFNYDLRGLSGGFTTNDAVAQRTADRPSPDNRGVISYPNYQVAVARRGDTVATVAARVGVNAEDLARYNGMKTDTALRESEVLALPTRVAEPSASTGAVVAGPLQPSNGIDVSAIATGAIDRAGDGGVTTTTLPAEPPVLPEGQSGKEPVRHKVARGETAYSIARLYKVSVRALAEWNGLGADLMVREGQYLLIPVVLEAAPAAGTSAPGQGSTTPVPPSAATALPDETTVKDVATPASPDLGGGTAAATGGRFVWPVQGQIIRDYQKKVNDGIDIAAPVGTAVKAADAGTVAVITRDTDQVPILVLRHSDNLLTVYTGIEGISVSKGDTVKRGQVVGKIRAGSPSFLHFEVREGLESVDPTPYLN